MTSVLSRAAEGALALDPFPHMLIDAALDAARYAELAARFPSLDVVNERGKAVRNNHLYLLSAREVVDDERIAPVWRTFFREHVAAPFWREALALLKPHLLAINPSLEQRAGRALEDFRVAMRGSDVDADVFLDCQFGVNSPVTHASTVRSPHIDNPNKLFNALLYCREDADDTAGGELLLYRCTQPAVYARGSGVLWGGIEEAKRVAYRANRLVLFLNSPRSVHGVAPRPKTPHVRRYVNFLCEFREPLFELPRASKVTRWFDAARDRLARDGARLGETV